MRFFKIFKITPPLDPKELKKSYMKFKASALPVQDKLKEADTASQTKRQTHEGSIEFPKGQLFGEKKGSPARHLFSYIHRNKKIHIN